MVPVMWIIAAAVPEAAAWRADRVETVVTDEAAAPPVVPTPLPDVRETTKQMG